MEDPWDDRDIRATLRGATAAKVLRGWYSYGSGAMRRYVVDPPAAETATYDAGGATAFCSMLRDGGVDLLDRASEPDVP